jgi:hypothetical protein
MLDRVHPEMASCGPGRRSPISAILDVALLRLWLRKCCGLGLNRDLPFLGGRLIDRRDFQRFRKKLEIKARECGGMKANTDIGLLWNHHA